MSTINQVGVGLTGSTGSGTFVGATSPTIVTPVIAQINDFNGNGILGFSPISSSVNFITLFNAATTGTPAITLVGSDTDIGLTISAKNAGVLTFQTTAVGTQVSFNTGTALQHNTTFSFANTASATVVTWPDASGTVAFTSGASGIVNAGTTNQLAYYAGNGTTVSGLATAASGVLVTSAGSVPSISSTLPAGLTVPTPKIAQINDTNGNTAAIFPATASAVNYIGLFNNSTAAAPIVQALGSDTNVGLILATQGAAAITLQAPSTGSQIVFTTGVGLTHSTGFAFPTTSASRTVTWPDADGTVSLLGNSSTGSGAIVLQTSPAITTPKITTSINDANGATFIGITAAGTAVNYLQINNNAASSYPGINAAGADSNIGINIGAKGAAQLGFQSALTSNQIGFNTGTALVHTTNFSFPATAASQTVTFPDATGTLLMTGQAISTVPSISFGGTALANYVESTFTPTIVSSGGGSVTYTLQQGQYTRIGNRVFVNIYVILASNSLGAGNLTIATLPITAAATCSLSFYGTTLGATATTSLMATTANASTSITLYKFTAGAASTLTAADTAATSQFVITGNYIV